MAKFWNFFKKEENSTRWLLTTAIIFFAVVLVLFLANSILALYFKDKICPNVFLNNLNLGGKTINEARDSLNEMVNTINHQGIIFAYKDQEITIFPIISSADGELAYEIIYFNPENTVSAAWNIGRNQDYFRNSWQRIKLLFKPRNIDLSFEIKDDEILDILQKEFAEQDVPAQNAQLEYDKLSGFSITKERPGKILDVSLGLSQMKELLRKGQTGKITLLMKDSLPEIYKKDCLNIENTASRIVNVAPIELSYEKSKWTVSREVLAGWLSINKTTQKNSEPEIVLAINPEKAAAYLNEFVAKKINIEPEETKFSIENGKVKEFQVGREGKKLLISESLEAIETSILTSKQDSVNLIATTVQSELSGSNSDSLGITEIIGVGKSNFVGSPSNRRHNIKVGADSLNGLLIKPGQEFSVVKALGVIDGSTGYLPELVIKGNKTTPEYGGGLCQIGTTIFRTAVNSGLPITMRRNHSYRVSYYEPAGTDAAIYDPLPDVRFVNDTENYILIQYNISGNNLSFEFWGKNDGRIATSTYPTIYNIVKPGPTKIVESPDLAPGEKKCTEKAHNGADAYFDYTVTYPNGDIKEERFKSHYVPWQEVCLVGAESVSASSSASTVNTDSETKPIEQNGGSDNGAIATTTSL